MTTSGWKIVSGTPANHEAIEQNVIERGQNFAACLLTLESADVPRMVTITGQVQCHGCRAIFSLEQEWVLSGGGVDSRIVTCPCGNQLDVMACRRTSGGHFLVVIPFTTQKGQQVGAVGLSIQAVVPVKKEQSREEAAGTVPATVISQCPKCGLRYNVPRKIRATGAVQVRRVLCAGHGCRNAIVHAPKVP